MQSSALEYRPTKWSEVIGHESEVRSLQSLLANSTPVCLGFGGSPGAGKTTLAKIVAQAIQPDVPENELDVRVINCGVNNGVDYARGLAEESTFRPLTGRYLVYILDEAHKLTEPAQDALLIPTELKGSSTVWILCTTEPQKLRPALKSRGPWYDLKGFKPNDIKKLYESLATKKNIEFPQDLFDETIQKGLTSPRDLCYALDRFCSGMSAKESVVGADDEQESQCFEVAQSVLKGWGATAARLKTLKPADAKKLRMILASYLGKVLLNATANKAQALSECLIRLSTQDTFEDSVSLAATSAALYLCCTKYHQGN